MHFKSISVIGLGYIGLPTAAIFANCNLRVIGVDINQEIVNTINRGEIHIVEPDLDQAVQMAVNTGHLRATTQPESADAFLIAVPTPFKADKNRTFHEPDLRYIESAAKAIAPVLKAGNLVVLESTSPVGATEQMSDWLAAARPDLSFPQTHGETSDIRIAHCPERVLPGQVLRELVHNDRVIGGLTPRCSTAAAALYKVFVQGECILTNVRTAEMCKLTENSFRDVNIGFANELSVICDKLDVNVWELIKLANHHPRVNILQPGPGVGGHCIAVDPWFIVSKTPDEAKLIRSAREINDSKPDWVVKKVYQAVQQTQKQHPTVACLGLSFKADIDDLRESPALAIAHYLAQAETFTVMAVEPNIDSHTFQDKLLRLYPLEQALSAADIVLVLVRHSEFANINIGQLCGKAVIDTCGFLPDLNL
jgi:UDP-N-acetyl-D-mannosaminuronic acid dehydrogenase